MMNVMLEFSLQVISRLFYIIATWNWDFDALEYVYHCKSCKCTKCLDGLRKDRFMVFCLCIQLLMCLMPINYEPPDVFL
jgi:hypothetical protein